MEKNMRLLLPLLFSLSIFCIDSNEVLWKKPQPMWNKNFAFESIERELSNEQILACIPMRDYLARKGRTAGFDNQVFVVLLQNGLKAVFKPGEGCYAEVAAYRASKFLNNKLVPPTVFRTIDNKKGSLQFLIDPVTSLPGEKEQYESLMNKVAADDIIAMKLFYFVFGQWDIGTDNHLLQLQSDGTYTIALIDNAGLMNKQQIKYGDYAYVCRGYRETQIDDDADKEFPFDNPHLFVKPNFEELSSAFSEFSDTQMITYMFNRYTKFKFCIWDNCLWIQYYFDHPFLKPNYVEECSMSLFERYKKLDKSALEEFWQEALLERKYHINMLINLTLLRRDEMCKMIRISNQ